MPHDLPAVPEFTSWPTFPFEGTFRVRRLDDPVVEEPPRQGEGGDGCNACQSPDSAYIWVADRWRVRALDRPSGLPMVLILESRSHLDLGDLPNLLAAELGVMTVRLERAIRSLEGVARVHVNRWGDGSAHLHLWFLARPYGRLQLRGTFLSLWDDIMPPIDEATWRENLGMVGAWLAEFGGRSLAEPPHLDWQSPSTFADLPRGDFVPGFDAAAEAAIEAVAEASDAPTDDVSTASLAESEDAGGASPAFGKADHAAAHPALAVEDLPAPDESPTTAVDPGRSGAIYPARSVKPTPAVDAMAEKSRGGADSRSGGEPSTDAEVTRRMEAPASAPTAGPGRQRAGSAKGRAKTAARGVDDGATIQLPGSTVRFPPVPDPADPEEAWQQGI